MLAFGRSRCNMCDCYYSPIRSKADCGGQDEDHLRDRRAAIRAHSQQGSHHLLRWHAPAQLRGQEQLVDDDHVPCVRLPASMWYGALCTRFSVKVAIHGEISLYYSKFDSAQVCRRTISTVIATPISSRPSAPWYRSSLWRAVWQPALFSSAIPAC